ncbi:MAG: hypothetical protein M3541_18935 [Acidobacteriota bacterium]|nr:hypothetical protein [Acidobacteriota bacterium]
MTTTAKTTFENMLRRHEIERTDLASEVLREEAEQATALRNALHPELGVALVEAMDAVETQLRDDRKSGHLHAKVETSLPSFADASFPPLSAADRREGRRQVTIFVPRPHAGGGHERLAIAMFDATASVFPHQSAGLLERERTETGDT